MIVANLCTPCVRCQIVESEGQWAVTVVPELVHLVGKGGSLEHIVKFPQSELRLSRGDDNEQLVVTGVASGDSWTRLDQQQCKKRKTDGGEDVDEFTVLNAEELFKLHKVDQCLAGRQNTESLVLKSGLRADPLLGSRATLVLDGLAGVLRKQHHHHQQQQQQQQQQQNNHHHHHQAGAICRFPPARPLLFRHVQLTDVGAVALAVLSDGTVIVVDSENVSQYSLGAPLSSADVCGDLLFFTVHDAPSGPLMCRLREFYQVQGERRSRYPSFLSWRSLVPAWGECVAVGVSSSGDSFAALTYSGDLLQSPFHEGFPTTKSESIKTLIESIAALTLEQKKLEQMHAAANSALAQLNEALCLYAERASLKVQFEIETGVSTGAVSLSVSLDNGSSVRISSRWTIVVLSYGAHSFPVSTSGIAPGTVVTVNVNPLIVGEDGFLMVRAFLVFHHRNHTSEGEEHFAPMHTRTHNVPGSMVIPLGTRRYDVLELAVPTPPAIGVNSRNAMKTIMEVRRRPSAHPAGDAQAATHAFLLSLNSGPQFQVDSCQMFSLSSGKPFRLLCRRVENVTKVNGESTDEPTAAALRAAVLIRDVQAIEDNSAGIDAGELNRILPSISNQMIRLQEVLSVLEANQSSADAVKQVYYESRRILATITM